MTASSLRNASTHTGSDFHDWTLWLGVEIAADRISSVEHHLGALARAGRRLQVVPASCDVLADPRQPEVARARAFAKVVSAVAETDSASESHPTAA